MFLLVIDGLGRRMLDVYIRGRITSCKITNDISLSHMMFVDDILAIRKTVLCEWIKIYEILSDFGQVTCLIMNKDMSVLFSIYFEGENVREITSLFNVQSISMEEGFKCFGFFPKPNGYNNKEGSWLIQKLEKHLFTWSHKWLVISERQTHSIQTCLVEHLHLLDAHF